MNNLDGIDLILFDVDGTCVTTKSGETFRKTADDWQWLPGRKEALQLLIAQGKQVTLITNQGGVGFGYFTAAQIGSEISQLIDDLQTQRGLYYICFSHPKATSAAYRVENDFQRKPNPGMLLQAMLDYGIGPRQTLMVGDRPEDHDAAHNAGCQFKWENDFFPTLTAQVGNVSYELHPYPVAELPATDNPLDAVPRFSPSEMRGLLSEAMDQTEDDDEPESLVDRVYAWMVEVGVGQGRTVQTMDVMAEFDLSIEDAETVARSATHRIFNEKLKDWEEHGTRRPIEPIEPIEGE
jgi:D-glycero-D-manno-heptose 1,7-bisphosphate phosphatase